MRNLKLPEINKYRLTGDSIINYFGSTGNENVGAFRVPYRNVKMFVIASRIEWDHVSVSLEKVNRCPTWDEMCFIKDLFFDVDEYAVQYHPTKDRYVNNHPYCLHLWRCQDKEMPMPPTELVGIK